MQYACHSGSNHIGPTTALVVLQQAGFTDAQGRTMLAIGYAESNLAIDAIGDCQLTGARAGYRSFGWLQILQSPRDQDDKAQIDDLLTAQGNANAAHMIYMRQGFNAWSTYKNGAYKKHLDDQASKSPGVVDSIGNAAGGLAKGVGGVVTGGVSSIGDGVAALVHAGQWLADRHNWIRIVEVITGVIAIVVGLNLISKDLGGPSLGGIAKGAAAAAAA